MSDEGWRGLPARGTATFEALVGRVQVGFPALSRRQAEVAVGVWRSLGDKEIAAWLGCSVHTVRDHRRGIAARLHERGVERRGDIIVAVERAMRAMWASEGGP